MGGTEQGSGGISGDPGGTIELGGGTLSDPGGSDGGGTFGGIITGGGGRCTSGAAPTIIQSPSVTPDPVTGTTAQVSVLATSAYVGYFPLTYTWSASSRPAGAPQQTFSSVGSANETVTFYQTGDYTLSITDAAHGGSTTGYAAVTVGQAATSIVISPNRTTVAPGQQHKFNAAVRDQFGVLYQPEITWKAVSGTIDSNGVYTAPSQAGTVTVTASAGGITASAGAATSNHTNELADPNSYQVTITGRSYEPGYSASDTSGDLTVAHSGWITAPSITDAVKQAIGGTVTLLTPTTKQYSPGGTFTFPDNIDNPPGFSFTLIGFNADQTTHSATGQIGLWDGDGGAPSDYDLFWDVSVEQATASTPTVDLLDDANNDGSVNSSDTPSVNVDPGKVILVSDPTQLPATNADSDHLAQMNISVTPNTSNGQTPADLTGWKLTLAATNDPTNIAIWSSMSKAIELDSAGIATFTISGGKSYNTTVYFEAAAEGTYTMQLTLSDASGNEQGSATAVVSAQQPTLIAGRINGANADGTPRLAGVLKHGAIAYMPVDSEVQDYIEDGRTIKPNKDQTDRVIKNDYGLLPFVVTIAHAVGAYYLKFPDSVRIYKSGVTANSTADADPARRISGDGTNAPTNIVPLLAGGYATFYAQGLRRDGSAEIDLDKQGSSTPVDKLTINIFEFGGPQNVPNYAKYNYSVLFAGTPPRIGTPPRDGQSRWSVPDQEQGSIARADGPNAAQIKWESGPTVGIADFAASPDYVWPYHVNIVRVDVTNAPGEQAFTLGRPNEDRISLTNVNFYSGTPFSPGIKWNADVTMIGCGASHTRGIDQIQFAFVQHLTAYIAHADYRNGGSLIHAGSSEYAAGDVNNSIVYPLIDKADDAPRMAPWMFGDATYALDASQTSGVIRGNDTPSMYVPQYHSVGVGQATPDDSLLAFYYGTKSFTLDVATYVPTPNSSIKLYARLATIDWTYMVRVYPDSTSSTGVRTAINQVYVGAGDAGQQNWKAVRDGSTENSFNPRDLGRFAPTANQWTNHFKYVNPNPR